MATKEVRKVKPYTVEWEAEADALARSAIKIRPCELCGHPAIEGYRCSFCGGDDSVDEGED